MAVIVGIHGIGQQHKSGPELTSAWWLALRGGLEAAGFRPKADALPVDALRVAFFGGLFRPKGAMAAGDATFQGPKYTAEDLEPGSERDMLTLLYESAAARDPSVPPGEGEMGLASVGVQQMLRRLAKSRALSGIVEHLFVRDLKQVNWFLDDSETKDVVLLRVDDEVADDTRIVVGHSLGSVVAYEYLCKYAPPGVELLVTVGSPLGIPNLVFDRLTPSPTEGEGAWPGSVSRWVNVADPDDVVPLVKQLAGLFPGLGGAEVVDRLVDNGDQPHMINGYLNSMQVGEAIGSVL